MTDHLPECHTAMIPDFHNERWICICAALRACEQRVRMEDDDYAYVAAQAEADGRRRGWVEALNAAREAVNSMVIETAGNSAATVNQAVAAIDALREKP